MSKVTTVDEMLRQQEKASAAFDARLAAFNALLDNARARQQQGGSSRYAAPAKEKVENGTIKRDVFDKLTPREQNAHIKDGGTVVD